ncbi:winged helix-turn-helix domain-containing protein [Actinophytocola sp.]|uniref:winged helix-turn-helix domain-containing protein n=1 Tax=Actinophytocola sp. TaxID=1872138 RepID=UPI002D397689|nr:winged helix-turn-helix domain-containing protein [Actinophytocola sp.]HYQ66175.1 winged helix-turn-helix domain-containing protein [Actinophytocola sp.]
MRLDRNQVAAELRKRIADDTYTVGSRLPGYRKLADEIGAAPNTVGEAMRLLAAEGLVEIVDKSGSRVRPQTRPEPASDRIAAAREELREVQAELRDARDNLDALEARVAGALANLVD